MSKIILSKIYFLIFILFLFFIVQIKAKNTKKKNNIKKHKK